MNPHFVIRFSGKGIKPESFSLDDLALLLAEVKAAIQERGGDPALASLVGIRRGSAAYAISVSGDVSADDALSGIVASFKVPPAERSPRQKGTVAYFGGINREKRCRTSFYSAGGGKVLEFKEKSPPPPAAVPQTVFREYATVTGKVVSAGGTKAPSADISTQDGKKVTVYGNRSQIKELAQRLYQEVRVEGPLSFDEQTGSVKMHSIAEISTFDPRGIADVFTELREKFGDKLNLGDKVDPVKYQRSIRG